MNFNKKLKITDRCKDILQFSRFTLLWAFLSVRKFFKNTVTLIKYSQLNIQCVTFIYIFSVSAGFIPFPEGKAISNRILLRRSISQLSIQRKFRINTCTYCSRIYSVYFASMYSVTCFIR